MIRAAVPVIASALILSVSAVAAAPTERHIAIKASRFVYMPARIVLKKGEPVVLELTALDRLHGFDLPDMHIRTDVLPGKVSEIRIVPDRVGTFDFHCDNFCGSGHESMAAVIVVEE